MDAKTYLKVSAINLAFLVAGALLWPAIVNSRGIFRTVHAQGKDKAALKNETPAVSPLQLDPNVDYVSSAVTLSGPVVTNTLLVNRIACDRLEVNGFEPLRLTDAIISMLFTKGILTSDDAKTIIQTGKAPRPLRIKPQP